MRFLCSAISAWAVFVSCYCYGPVYPRGIHGSVLDTAGPLLFSNYPTAYTLFQGTELWRYVGFMNIALLAPNHVITLAAGAPGSSEGFRNEAISLERNIRQLQLAKSLESPLVTNKRVIVILNSVSPDGKRISIKINHQTVDFEAGEFGIHLSRFFNTHNIEVSQLDLLAGHGDTLGKRIFEGMKMTGMKDFSVRCLKEGRITIFPDNEISLSVSVDDQDIMIDLGNDEFLRKGQLFPPGQYPEDDFVVFTDGTPDPITPPPVHTSECTP